MFPPPYPLPPSSGTTDIKPDAGAFPSADGDEWRAREVQALLRSRDMREGL